MTKKIMRALHDAAIDLVKKKRPDMNPVLF
jgi:hypothetical protein